MKKSELRQIIREEISKLNEGPEFEDGNNDNARDKALIDLFDDFR